MNRIDKKFKDLGKANKKAFIAYVVSGYPDIGITEKLVPEIEKAGVDIVELGVPFSDPLADGAVIQAASQKALLRGITLTKILTTVKKIRKVSDIALVLMSYYNPIAAYGMNKFITDAIKAGVDGVIIPDLPADEAGLFNKEARKKDLCHILLVTPTTSQTRIKKITGMSTGFIYYVSLTGVTGARKNLAQDIEKQVDKIKSMTKKPVCVGFGVSNPEQVRLISNFADGVIVGSALVNMMGGGNRKDLIKKTIGFIKRLKGR